MKKLLSILLTLATLQSIACINEYRTLLNGQTVFAETGIDIPYFKNLDTNELKKELADLEFTYKADNSIKTLSDYGVILIYLGRLNEAIDLYRKIERQQPDLYTTASNLGTAFELAGQLDSAYFYINKAININPQSHLGSEWIHLKILAAKKKLQSNPDNLTSINVLGLDFGQDDKPSNPKNLDLKQIENQIRFQLSERLTFVKPPDPIVGQILFDLANISAQTKDVETALAIYSMAEQFGYSSDLQADRISSLKFLAYLTTLGNFYHESPLLTLFISGILVLVILWLTIKFVKGKINKHRR